jgi:hypothetical protein
VVMGHVSSEYSRFPLQLLFHQMLNFSHLSFRTGKTDHLRSLQQEVLKCEDEEQLNVLSLCDVRSCWFCSHTGTIRTSSCFQISV